MEPVLKATRRHHGDILQATFGGIAIFCHAHPILQGIILLIMTAAAIGLRIHVARDSLG